MSISQTKRKKHQQQKSTKEDWNLNLLQELNKKTYEWFAESNEVVTSAGVRQSARGGGVQEGCGLRRDEGVQLKR